MVSKAFAVSETPLPRKNAASPLSVNWTLYDPQKLAEDLGIPLEVLDAALERNGFSKAVRIREEVIKWKTRLINEQRHIYNSIKSKENELRRLKLRDNVIRNDLTNIRNILRISRENDNNGTEK